MWRGISLHLISCITWIFYFARELKRISWWSFQLIELILMKIAKKCFAIKIFKFTVYVINKRKTNVGSNFKNSFKLFLVIKLRLWNWELITVKVPIPDNVGLKETNLEFTLAQLINMSIKFDFAKYHQVPKRRFPFRSPSFNLVNLNNYISLIKSVHVIEKY